MSKSKLALAVATSLRQEEAEYRELRKDQSELSERWDELRAKMRKIERKFPATAAQVVAVAAMARIGFLCPICGLWISRTNDQSNTKSYLREHIKTQHTTWEARNYLGLGDLHG